MNIGISTAMVNMRKSSGITRKSKAPRMIVIPSKMKSLDMQINTAENGILLPYNSKVPLSKGSTIPNEFL
ncbi:hypothetical protein [Kosakonia cowanii]|uniref:hypothetical protein n=1 Tax=Kosakonia cowanii TaxID=208223 RepID=UPI004064B0BA